MSWYRRQYIPGGTHFFTLVTAGRYPLFQNPGMIHHLRCAFQAVRRNWPFTIEAIVVLPDHLHAIWTLPKGDIDYSTRWRLIKARLSHQVPEGITTSVSKRRRGEKGLWQRRFWEHTIRDDEDLRRHAEYIHYNPVKHGLVKRPIDWPWSSFHREVQLNRYPPDWGASNEPAGIRHMDPE